VPDPSPSGVTVTWAGGTATITVGSGLDSLTSAQVREQIASVADNGPQRLVLDLVAVGDSFAAESLALIAVARHLVPPDCTLDVRSASPAVRQILGLAGWSGLESGTNNISTESGNEGGLRCSCSRGGGRYPGAAGRRPERMICLPQGEHVIPGWLVWACRVGRILFSPATLPEDMHMHMHTRMQEVCGIFVPAVDRAVRWHLGL
jgi:anti-anti-sigma regulatory factor